MPRKFRKQTGFTLVELVTVLILMAVLGLVGFSKFFGAQSFRERGFADTSLNALRHAHRLAVATGCHTQADFSGAGYALRQRSSCTSGGFSADVVLPGGGAFTDTPPPGVTQGSADLYFDANGRPFDTATDNPLTAPLNISIGGRTLSVEPVTGYTRLL